MAVQRTYRFAVLPEWVVFHPGLQAVDVRVFAVLDRFADDDGACWPGLATIAERAGVSEATIRRSIRRMEDLGVLSVARRADEDGRQRSNLYTLAGDAPLRTPPATGARGEGATGATLGGTTGGRGTLAPVVPERESLELELDEREPEGTKTPRGVSDDAPDFVEFWNVYPRKIGKGHARQAWRTATEKKRVAASVIIESAAIYAAQVAVTDPQFIPHPSTWLNGERWGDDPSAAPAPGSRRGLVDGFNQSQHALADYIGSRPERATR